MAEKVDFITSNEQHVRMKIYDGDLQIDEAGAELLRIEKAQHASTRALKDAEIASLRENEQAYAEKVAAKDARIAELESLVIQQDKRNDERMTSEGLAVSRVAELTEALRPFAEAKECLDPSYLQNCDHVAIFDTGADQAIKVGDVIRAFNVLNNGCQATASQAESPGSDAARLPNDQSGSEE